MNKSNRAGESYSSDFTADSRATSSVNIQNSDPKSEISSTVEPS